MRVEDDTDRKLQALGLRDVPDIALHIVQVPKSTVMFRAGELCLRYPVVLFGSVRVCRISPLGHDVVFYRVQAGEGCAVSAGCLLEDQRYPVFGVADSDTCVLLLPANLFRENLTSNATFREFVFRQYSTRMGALMARIDSLISEGPGPRLVRYLLARMENDTVAMTHAELAADIGTAREVVSRNLGMLARAGWIRQRRQAIEIVDMAALRSLANEVNKAPNEEAAPSRHRNMAEAACDGDSIPRPHGKGKCAEQP